MTKIMKRTMLAVSLILLSAPSLLPQKLSEKLSILKPFIGPTWEGSIPGDSRMGDITLKWEVLLNGFAVKLTRTVHNFDHRLETTYYWDESAGKIAFLGLSNNGVSIKGHAAGQGEELICEGAQRGPDIDRQSRRIYRLDKDGKLYEDDLFRNSDSEDWRRTHVSVFVAKIKTGSYLGQKLPGMIPEVFAPGIVSKEGDQGRLFVAPDGSEIIYWEREPVNRETHIISLRSESGAWTAPAVLPFSREHVNNEPCLSPDGRKLFFVSNRPRDGKGEVEKWPSIWMSEKTQGEWGAPHRISAFDGIEIVVQPYSSADGRLYVMGQSGGARSLYFSTYSKDEFSAPVKLEEKAFSGQVSGPCLSPDGRTLIFHARREEGYGGWDLYASFLDPAGAWRELRSLGEIINSAEDEAGASFSPDGRFLFFSRKGDICWVSAKVIEELRPKGFN